MNNVTWSRNESNATVKSNLIKFYVVSKIEISIMPPQRHILLTLCSIIELITYLYKFQKKNIVFKHNMYLPIR